MHIGKSKPCNACRPITEHSAADHSLLRLACLAEVDLTCKFRIALRSGSSSPHNAVHSSSYRTVDLPPVDLNFISVLIKNNLRWTGTVVSNLEIALQRKLIP